jgi:PKD repeat protein
MIRLPFMGSVKPSDLGAYIEKLLNSEMSKLKVQMGLRRGISWLVRASRHEVSAPEDVATLDFEVQNDSGIRIPFVACKARDNRGAGCVLSGGEIRDVGPGRSSTVLRLSFSEIADATTVVEVQMYMACPASTNLSISPVSTNLGFAVVRRAPESSFRVLTSSVQAGAPCVFTNLSKNATGFGWDFGDRSKSSEANPIHIYDSSGTYSVTLRAVNAGGAASTTRADIVVRPAPAAVPAPVAAFSASPTAGLAPLRVAFTNLSRHAASYAWVLGNGETSTHESPSTVYSVPGRYEITLKAAAPDGRVSWSTGSVSVVARPIARFSAAPMVGDAPLAVAFTSLSVNANSIRWSYGNGVTDTQACRVVSYETPGEYRVTLTAYGIDGASSASTATIAVGSALVADFALPGTIELDEILLVTNLSKGARSYSWDVDGRKSVGRVPAGLRFHEAGPHRLVLTAFTEDDQAGRSASRAKVVEVVPGGSPPLLLYLVLAALALGGAAWVVGRRMGGAKARITCFRGGQEVKTVEARGRVQMPEAFGSAHPVTMIFVMDKAAGLMQVRFLTRNADVSIEREIDGSPVTLQVGVISEPEPAGRFLVRGSVGEEEEIEVAPADR